MRRFKKLFVALLVVATVLGTVTTFASAAGSLSDIEGTKYEAAVKALTGLNIVTGFPDGTYKANATLTRAMAAAIMVRALGLDDTAKLSKGATPFTDVPATDWASGYVNVAYAQNIINGIGNNQFAPLREVTYAELATMLVRAAGLAKEAVGPWPTNFITVATKYGLTAGTDFSASKPATRGDTALMTNVTVFGTKNPDTGKTIAQSVFKVGPKLASITVTGSATNVAVGGQVTFTAKGTDADGKAMDITPTWSVDKNGVVDQSGIFGASASGVATITAKVGDVSGTATVNVYGTATAMKLSTPGTIVANGKSTTTLTATIVDAAGNTVGNYSGNVAFTATGGGVTLSSGSVAVANGVASVTLTSAAAGNTATTYVNASCNGLTGSFVAVTPAAQTLTSFVLSADPATLAADGVSSTKVSVTAKDQEGQTMAFPADVTGTLTVSDTNIASFGSNATASVNSGATFANLTAKANIGSATVSGAFKKSGTSLSLPVTNATVNTLVVGAPYKLAIDTVASATADTAGATATAKTQTVVARVLDVNGNQVTGTTFTGLTPQVSLTITPTAGSGGAPVVAGPTFGAGTATWTVTDTKAETVSYTVKGTYNTTPAITLASATASGTFTAGPITQITLTGSPLSGSDVLLNATGATGTLTASLADSAGNPVSAGSYSITFKKDSNANATASFADTTVTSVNGSASVSVTSTTNNGVTDVYKAYVTVSGTQYASAGRNVITRIMGPANKLSVADVLGQTAGTAFTVKAYVQDYAGTTVTTDSGRAVTLTVYDSTGAAVGTYTATSSLGSASFSVTLNTADTGYYYKATSTGLVDSANSTAFNVGSGTATTITVTPNLTTIGADGSHSTVTFALADAYGNAVTVTAVAGLDITVSNSSTAAGSIAATVNIAQNASSAPTDFISTALPGSATITGSATGYTSGSATINTITVGSAAKLGITAIKDATAGGTQSIYVQVLDAAGNRVTVGSYSPTILMNITTSAGTTYGVAPTTAYDRGQAKFTFIDTKAETVTYYAYTTAPSALQTYTATGNFVAASATKVVLSVLPSYVVANGSSVATITAKVTDANNNTVPSATGTMKFSITSGNDFGTLLATSAPIVNGVATVQLQSKTGAGLINLSASVDGSTTITAGNASYITYAGTPSNVVVTAVVSAGTATLTAVVRDQYGNAINGAALAPNPNVGQKVTFTRLTGAGTITTANPTLDANGQAQTTYTGAASGDTIRVTIDNYTSVTYTVTIP